MVIARRRSRRSNLLMLVSLFAMACSPESPPERQEPVVVYAAFEDDSHLVDIFDRYKEQTGVLVIVRRGPAGKIVDDLINNNISPPADVLMTSSVVHAWRAAEEGALRPLLSEVLREHVPEWARDADDLWFGTASRGAVVVHNPPAADVSGIEDFAALADKRFEGSLCLSSSGLAVNRMIIAMMINELGGRPTELIVRDWVRNLAAPPFETEARLMDALEAGTCGVAIVSSDVADYSGMNVHLPAATYADVATIGVARHARNPDGAAALAEWLAFEIEGMPIKNDQHVSQAHVSLFAWNYEDAVRLAERARYR